MPTSENISFVFEDFTADNTNNYISGEYKNTLNTLLGLYDNNTVANYNRLYFMLEQHGIEFSDKSIKDFCSATNSHLNFYATAFISGIFEPPTTLNYQGDNSPWIPPHATTLDGTSFTHADHNPNEFLVQSSRPFSYAQPNPINLAPINTDLNYYVSRQPPLDLHDLELVEVPQEAIEHANEQFNVNLGPINLCPNQQAEDEVVRNVAPKFKITTIPYEQQKTTLQNQRYELHYNSQLEEKESNKNVSLESAIIMNPIYTARVKTIANNNYTAQNGIPELESLTLIPVPTTMPLFSTQYAEIAEQRVRQTMSNNLDLCTRRANVASPFGKQIIIVNQHDRITLPVFLQNAANNTVRHYDEHHRVQFLQNCSTFNNNMNYIMSDSQLTSNIMNEEDKHAVYSSFRMKKNYVHNANRLTWHYLIDFGNWAEHTTIRVTNTFPLNNVKQYRLKSRISEPRPTVAIEPAPITGADAKQEQMLEEEPQAR